jgi:hypothetical protein
MARALFVAEHAGDDRRLLAAMLTSANSWGLIAGVCELPDGGHVYLTWSEVVGRAGIEPAAGGL